MSDQLIGLEPIVSPFRAGLLGACVSIASLTVFGALANLDVYSMIVPAAGMAATSFALHYWLVRTFVMTHRRLMLKEGHSDHA